MLVFSDPGEVAASGRYDATMLPSAYPKASALTGD